MRRFFKCAIVPFLMLLLNSHVSYAQDKADPSSNSTPPTTSEETDIPTAPPPEEPQEKAKDEYKGIASKDLAAQERMANAAEEMSDLVFFQNIIGGIGLFLVGLTALFAWGAWRAGERAVAATREIGSEQLKAYIVISEAFIITIQDGKGFIFAADFKIKNVGQTPAFNIKIHCVPFTSQNRMEPDEIAPEVPDRDKVVAGYLAQNCDAEPGFFAVQGVDISIASDGGGGEVVTHNADTFIIARGVVEFDDIYTIADKKLPKRTVTFYRFMSSHNLVGTASKIKMSAVQWKEAAT